MMSTSEIQLTDQILSSCRSIQSIHAKTDLQHRIVNDLPTGALYAKNFWLLSTKTRNA